MTKLIAVASVFAALLCVDGMTNETRGQRFDSPAGGSVSLSALLPDAEQVALGLNQLTDDQRTSLAVLLAGYYFAGLDDAVQEASIDGDFEGWDGETLLELDDGTVFRQSEYHYEYHYSYNPDVIVLVKPFRYELMVEGTDQPVEVDLLGQSRYATRHYDRVERFRSLLLGLSEDARRRVSLVSIRGARR